MTWEVEPTLLEESAKGAPAELQLVVIADGHVHTRALWGDTVVIGRGEDADVQLDDPAVSRNHAKISTLPGLTIEDLGSANGTRIRGGRLPARAPQPLAVGEVVEIGAAMIVLQNRAVARPPRRVRPHAHFEARLEDECDRPARARRPFVVMRVRLDGPPPGAAAELALTQVLEAGELLAAFGPGEYELLLLDLQRGRVDRVITALGASLGALGHGVRLGHARFPDAGTTPDALLASAAVAPLGATTRPPTRLAPGGFVVADPAMFDLHRLVERVAQGTIAVLLLGETGVGKEVLAHALHACSPRRAGPFVRLNCAALGEALVEAELFGYEKGAFTGADQAKPGLMETASGGTIFLDEVGELSLAAQAKLLRALEQREVLRVGGLKPRPIDVRVVSATNRDLDAEVAAARFRSDLFYRLNGVALRVPPLRERPGEVALLAERFVARAAEELGLPLAPTLAPAALALLEGYAWPGNVRELRNVVDRAVLLAAGEATIEPIHLPLDKLAVGRRAPSRPERAARPAARGRRRLRADPRRAPGRRPRHHAGSTRGHARRGSRRARAGRRDARARARRPRALRRQPDPRRRAPRGLAPDAVEVAHPLQGAAAAEARAVTSSPALRGPRRGPSAGRRPDQSLDRPRRGDGKRRRPRGVRPRGRE